MKQLTIRNVPPDLARALDKERRKRNSSLNRTVIELLGKALGLTPKGTYHNGLEKLAGTWSQEEFEQFEQNIAVFEQVDEEMWR